MADHIPDEAATAAARAAYSNSVEWDKLSDVAQAIELHAARLMLTAALPALNTAKDSEIREVIAAELDRRAEEFVNQARVFGNPHDSTPAAGTVATLLDLAREFRTDAASLRGEQ